MSTLFFLLVLFSIVSIFHAGVLSKIFAPFLVSQLMPLYDWSTYRKFNPNEDRMKLVSSIIFFFGPIFIFKNYKNFSYRNETLDISIIIMLIIITVFLTHFNYFKVFKIKNEKDIKKKAIIDQPLTKRELQKLNKNHIKNIEKLEHFIELTTKHKAFNEVTFQFDFTQFEIDYKRLPKQTWAYYTLIVMFFEEILNDKNYLSKLESRYFLPLNRKINNVDDKLKSINWSTYKKHYIKNEKLEDLKRSDFYTSLLTTYNNLHLNSNNSNN